MAVVETTTDVPETHRPEWLENIGGQLLALLTALGIAVLLGAVIIVAYGEDPITVYRAIASGSFGDKNGFGYVLANAGPLIFSALAVSVCFKGGMFNIGVEGQFIVGMASASLAALTFCTVGNRQRIEHRRRFVWRPRPPAATARIPPAAWIRRHCGGSPPFRGAARTRHRHGQRQLGRQQRIADRRRRRLRVRLYHDG